MYAILLASTLAICTAFPTVLECASPLTQRDGLDANVLLNATGQREFRVGSQIMNAEATLNTARTAVFERDGTALECGGTYEPGETLVGKMSSIDGGVRYDASSTHTHAICSFRTLLVGI